MKWGFILPTQNLFITSQTSPEAHWLRLFVHNAGGMGSIPGWGRSACYAPKNKTKSIKTFHIWASLVTQTVKNLPVMRETWVWSLGWEIPWRREWQPTPVFLPGESHEQRSLVSYSPWGRSELDMTDRLTHTCAVTRALLSFTYWGFSGGARGKESACQCKRLRRCEFLP